jgi:PAS domain S-box-containing protein
MKKHEPAARSTVKRSLRPLGPQARAGTRPSAAAATVKSGAEFQRVVHELQVHQEELEAQNEELRETQQLLEASRDRYADLYDFAPIGYITLDGKGHIREINLTGATILGRERSRLLDTLFSVAVAKDDLSVFHSHLRQCQQGSGPVTTELILAVRDRDPVPVQLYSIPLLDLSGQTTMYRTAITDITERKQAETILRLAHDQLEDRVRERTAELAGAVAKLRNEISERERTEQTLRELSVRLLQTQDEERRRIARELHDSTGQKLAALGMNLSLIGKSAETLDARARKALAESLDLLDRSSRDIRTLSYLLHPPLLDERGLAAAVRWFADGFTQRSEVQVKLEVPLDLPRLPAEIEIALFRIVQEGLTNIHRHSGSSTATIRLMVDQNHVELEMRDAGKGLPKPRSDCYVSPLGVGITGMRERVKQLGGQMKMESGSCGTTVSVTLPLTKAAS